MGRCAARGPPFETEYERTQRNNASLQRTPVVVVVFTFEDVSVVSVERAFEPWRWTGERRRRPGIVADRDRSSFLTEACLPSLVTSLFLLASGGGLPPRAASACCLARMFGASVLVVSVAPDMGEVSCFSSHAVTADRSYVYPSSTNNTGSSKSSAVMGHTSCSASKSAVSSADMVSGSRGRASAGVRASLFCDHAGLPGRAARGGDSCDDERG